MLWTVDWPSGSTGTDDPRGKVNGNDQLIKLQELVITTKGWTEMINWSTYRGWCSLRKSGRKWSIDQVSWADDSPYIFWDGLIKTIFSEGLIKLRAPIEHTIATPLNAQLPRNAGVSIVTWACLLRLSFYESIYSHHLIVVISCMLLQP